MNSSLDKVKRYFKKYYIVYIIMLVFLTIDLVTKAVTKDITMVVIPNILTFVYTENTGGAFSMMSNNTIFLTIVSAIFIAIIVILDKIFKSDNMLYRVGYSFVLTGAIGNLIDRVLFGYVRDFIRLDFMDFTHINTIFNVADICVTAGVCLIVLFFIMSLIKEKKSEK